MNHFLLFSCEKLCQTALEFQMDLIVKFGVGGIFGKLHFPDPFWSISSFLLNTGKPCIYD